MPINLSEQATTIARAWVSILLGADEEEMSQDLVSFHRKLLHPFLAEHGSVAGFALCQSFAELAAAYLDISADLSDKTAIEIMTMELDDSEPFPENDE